MGVQPPKLVFFGINFNLPKMVYPLRNFYKSWLGGGRLRSAPSRKISPLWLLKYGLTAPKIVKNGNFWYTFAPKGKFWGSTEKVEYRCITTTRMQWHHNCFENIALLHSVSLITNCNSKAWQTNKQTKKSHFSSTASATHDRHHTWHGDRGGPKNFCTP